MLGIARVLVAVATVLVAAATTAGPAFSQWATQLVADPDGRGQPIIMQAPTADGTRYLQFWCRGDQRRVALLAYDGLDSPLLNGPTGIVLEIRPDSGGIWSGGGDLYRHEPGWAGLAYRNTHEVRALAEAIVAAKSEIVVNVTDLGTQDTQSFIFSAKGSTASGRDFLAKCFGAGTTAPSPPAVQAAGTESPWIFSIEDDPVNGGEQQSIVGPLGSGLALVVVCDGRKVPALLVATPLGELPYEVGDVGLNFYLSIDGQERMATGEVLDTADFRTVTYTARDYLPDIFRALAGAREVGVRLYSYSNDVTIATTAPSLQGFAEGVAQINTHCFGDAATAATPAPPPAQTSPAGVPWKAQTGALPDGQPLHLISGEAVEGGGAVTLACGPTEALALGFTAARQDPLPTHDVGVALRVTVTLDGRTIELYGNVDASSDISTTVLVRSEVIPQILAGLAEGASTMRVEVAFLGGSSPFVRDIDLTGSAVAAAALAAKCQESPEIPAATGPTQWEAFRGEDVPEFDAIGVMASPSGPDGVYAALVCTGFSDEWGIRMVGPNDDDAFPFNNPSASHTLVVELGNTSWQLNSGFARQIAGNRAIHFDDDDADVLEILGVFSLTVSSIKLTLTDDSSGEARAWTITPANSDNAASQLFAVCYGG